MLKNLFKVFSFSIFAVAFLLVFISYKYSYTGYTKEFPLLRLGLFIISGSLVLCVRFIISFLKRTIKIPPKGEEVLSFTLITPSLLILLMGFWLSIITSNPKEFIPFFAIGIYHWLRFYPSLIKRFGTKSQ